MKYREDEILDEVKEYIGNTYNQHYSTTKDGFQVQDMLRQLDIDKDFCQANAIKYLCRYGKKDGYNRKDLLKAIHYIVLLMSSEDEEYMNQMEEDAIEVNKNLYRKKTYYTLVIEQEVLAKDKDEADKLFLDKGGIDHSQINHEITQTGDGVETHMVDADYSERGK